MLRCVLTYNHKKGSIVATTVSFFVPTKGRRGYIMYGSGLISDYFNTQEAALEEAGNAYFIGELTQSEYRTLEQVIKASSLPLDGTGSNICEPG